MSQTKCPHCGFLNFAISAYCGRCERPLKVETPTVVAPQNPPTSGGQQPIRSAPPRAPKLTLVPPPLRSTQPLPSAETPPPKDVEKTVIDQNFLRTTVTDLNVNEPAFTGSEESETSPLFKRLTPKKPTAMEEEIATVAAAPPPEQLAALRASAAEDRRTTVEQQRATPPPQRSTLNEGPTQMSAASPELWHVAAATVLDGLFVAAFGLALAAGEMLVFDVHWPTDASGLDALAVWLHLYPHTALRAIFGMVVFSLGYTFWGARRGRTLGRAALGLRLVQKEGTPVSFVFAGIRAVASVASVGLFGAGFFWMIVDTQHRTWPDLVSRAVVVKR